MEVTRVVYLEFQGRLQYRGHGIVAGGAGVI